MLSKIEEYRHKYNFTKQALKVELSEEEFYELSKASYIVNKIIPGLIPASENIFMFLRLCVVENDKSHTNRMNLAKEKAVGKVLDFGGGIGKMSAILADAKYSVDYWDVNRFCREYVRETYPKVHILEDLNGTSKYDTIIFFDTLPYIDDVPALNKFFKSKLNPGGRLFMGLDKRYIKQMRQVLENLEYLIFYGVDKEGEENDNLAKKNNPT